MGGMGVNNRQRRKAKKQQQEQRRAQRAHVFPPRPRRERPAYVDIDVVQLARDGVLAAVETFRSGSDAEYRVMLEALGFVEERAGRDAIHQAVSWWIERSLDRAWNSGWQPADVMRFLRRGCTARHADALVALVAASGGRRPEAAADDRWSAQVAALSADSPAPAAFRSTSPGLALAVEALSDLLRLPPIPRLSASTSSGTARTAGGPGTTAMLDRVRALLAKAESTTFAEEAEALTAKAQELMARHAIDAAMLDAGRAAGGTTVAAWRIGVDDPYADAKSLLLDRIARANRSSAVWCKDLGSSTVFGDRSDLEMVELLFTSLLVQATEPMLRAGRSVDRYGRSRTTSFRKSFLVSYAVRIGERLAAATESAVAEGAERHGSALLPVLASRAEAVDEALHEAFPDTYSRGPAASNHSGWLAGRAAAEMASLGVGQELATG